MSDWLPTGSEQQRDERYLRIPDPASGTGTSAVVLRVLDERPKDVWQHWIGGKLFRCGGYKTCALCDARNEAKRRDPVGFRNTHRLTRRFLINVLLLAYEDDKMNITPVNPPEVKILSFSKELGEQLALFTRTTDLRDMDIKVYKIKSGVNKWDIKYNAVQGEKRPLGKEESVIAETRYDLAPEVAPSTPEELAQAAASMGTSAGGAMSYNPADHQQSSNGYAGLPVVLEVKALAQSKGYSLSDFFPGVPETQYKVEDLEKVRDNLAKV